MDVDDFTPQAVDSTTSDCESAISTRESGAHLSSEAPMSTGVMEDIPLPELAVEVGGSFEAWKSC